MRTDRPVDRIWAYPVYVCVEEGGGGRCPIRGGM